MVVTLGQQYNVEEKPAVTLYTYTNRHAEPPNITHYHSNTYLVVTRVVIIYDNSAIAPYRNINSRGLGQHNSKLSGIKHVCVCVCVFSSHSFWTSMDVPAGVTQEEGNTGFSIHLLSAVLALIFLARRIQPFLSLVDREVEFCVLTI